MTPSTVHSIVNEFSSYDGVSVDERTDSYCVRVAKPPECIVEILIPRHRLEWFVTVIEPTTEDQILNDWMDHYSTGSESATELEMEIRQDSKFNRGKLYASAEQKNSCYNTNQKKAGKPSSHSK